MYNLDIIYILKLPNVYGSSVVKKRKVSEDIIPAIGGIWKDIKCNSFCLMD